MEFAFGQMGLSPRELAELTPFQFELKCKGYRSGLLVIEENFRKLGWIVFAMNADPKSSKKTTLDDIWPTTETVKLAKERNKITENLAMQTLNKFMQKKQTK